MQTPAQIMSQERKMHKANTLRELDEIHTRRQAEQRHIWTPYYGKWMAVDRLRKPILDEMRPGWQIRPQNPFQVFLYRQMRLKRCIQDVEEERRNVKQRTTQLEMPGTVNEDRRLIQALMLDKDDRCLPKTARANMYRVFDKSEISRKRLIRERDERVGQSDPDSGELVVTIKNALIGEKLCDLNMGIIDPDTYPDSPKVDVRNVSEELEL